VAALRDRQRDPLLPAHEVNPAVPAIVAMVVQQTSPREWLHVRAVELARKPTPRPLGIGASARFQGGHPTAFLATPSASRRSPSFGEVCSALPFLGSLWLLTQMQGI
jgi:hypothetical protein